MRKFKFTLEALLNVTVALEKECKNKLALINAQLAQLYEVREGYYAAIGETKEIYTYSKSINDFINARRYIDRLEELVIQIGTDISAKEYERDSAQNELIETMKKRKTYERLREKQYIAYKKEVELEENKILDDFISSNRR
jgi:flagellar FliJ protein